MKTLSEPIANKLRKLSDKDMADIINYVKSLDPLNKYCPFKPFPIQQKLLKSNKKEILFGGGAGSSKTIASLMKALQDVSNGNYSCLIIRNTFADLSQPGCQIDISKKWWIKTDAKYNGSTYQWQFPTGAKITFGYLDHPDDKLKYRSSEFTRIIVDEASLILPDSLIYMFSRLRSSDPALKTQMIYLTNPSGPAHEWLKQRFIVENNPDREYIFATFRDNLSLNQDEYEQNLLNLGTVEYKQLALGEWITDMSTNMYHLNDYNILHGQPPNYDTYIMSIDLGFNDDSSITLIGINKHEKQVYVVYSKKYQNTTVTDLATYAKELNNQYNPYVIVVDSAGAGKMITQELVKRYDLPCKSAEKQEKEAYIKLLNADLEHHNMYIWDGCKDLIKEMNSLQRNLNTGKENQYQANHSCDSMLYAYKESRHYRNKPEEPKLTVIEQWEDDLLSTKPDSFENDLFG